MNTAINWCAAGVAALLIAASCNLDGPDDHSTERAIADDLQAAIKAQDAAQRFERAAAAMCGNGGYVVTSDNAIKCVNRKTKQVQL